ncbi:MAG: sulfatase [Acidobacteriota bacterium]
MSGFAAHDASENGSVRDQARLDLPRSLRDWALAGMAAVLLLSAVEWIDVAFKLTDVFTSIPERAAFTVYFSLNLLSGAVIGLVAGLLAGLASVAKRKLETVLARGNELRRWHKLTAGGVVAATIAAVLHQLPEVRSYVTGLIIEAQKLPYLYGRLLRFESVLSYLILFGMVIACGAIWWLATNAELLRRWQHASWLAGLTLVMLAAYYVDSRYQVQLYEYTLHRTMFLVAMAAAMALIASSYNASPRARSLLKSPSRQFLGLAGVAGVVLLSSVVFTFVHFGKNQNLKAQILLRTTQAKQHIRLAQWVLDFDRDGYSALLDGGDRDDWRADINPGRIEIVDDGIDNNLLGGDLTEPVIKDWFSRRLALNQPPAAAPNRLNVVYIFIDTLRADHLSCQGYPRNTSPNIDRLAARSALFENALSPSANTFESAARFMKSSYWDAQVESWTEVLARNGYDVLLFPERRLGMLNRYVKGARVVQDAKGKLISGTIDVAIDTLGALPPNRPFCAYIYAVEPHRPYAWHKEFDFGSALIDLYDSEIAFTDHHLGRLFDWLETSGRMRDTMIVVMSDHGESFGERGVYRHSSQLFNDQTHVPSIFYLPGVEPRRVADYVSTIDLGTTILHAAGIASPDQYAGVTLLPLMRGEAFEHPEIYGEQTLMEKEFPNIRPEDYPQPVNKKYMIVTQEGYKLILDRNYWVFQLFDLKTDPFELHNLASEKPKRFDHLEQRLGRFIDIVTVSRPANADEAKYNLNLKEADDTSEDTDN